MHKIFHVMPGYNCNLFCSHCVNESGPKESQKLSDTELNDIKQYVSTSRLDEIIFTGGEPTLHIDIINEIISNLKDKSKTRILITTNGWFSTSEEEMLKTLSRFSKIDSIQLSYDTFHGSNLKKEDILRLKNFCILKGYSFNISVCLSSPLDLVRIGNLQEELSVNIIFQKVEASGRALKNKKFFQYPTFQKEVLDTQCPNLGQISYIAGRGFSTCCSNLMFNKQPVQGIKISHNSVPEHIGSDFYKELSTLTFREILNLKNKSINKLTSEYSSPCKVCEYAYSQKE